MQFLFGVESRPVSYTTRDQHQSKEQSTILTFLPHPQLTATTTLLHWINPLLLLDIGIVKLSRGAGGIPPKSDLFVKVPHIYMGIIAGYMGIYCHICIRISPPSHLGAGG